jgi:hypothetical protein
LLVFENNQGPRPLEKLHEFRDAKITYVVEHKGLLGIGQEEVEMLMLDESAVMGFVDWLADPLFGSSTNMGKEMGYSPGEEG